MQEILFLVEQAEDGSFRASAAAAAIHTEADMLEDLHLEIRDVDVFHFDPGQAPYPRLRAGPSASPPPLESNHPLLASAGGGLDRSTISGKHHPSDYIGAGRLFRGRGDIFPGSHRSANPSSMPATQGQCYDDKRIALIPCSAFS